MSGILKIQRCSGLFYVWLLLAMVSWGSSWVNAKVLSGYLNAFEMIFLRFGIAFFALMPIIWSTERSFRISLKSFSISIILALFLMAYSYSYFLGATFGMASLGGAMVNTMAPILTFILLVLLGVRMMSVYDFLGIKKLGVAKVSIFGFLIPFASIFLGAIFLGESIDIFVIIGTILTLFAIRILNHTTSKR